MSDSAASVALAMASGLSIVCATCEKYHQARSKGIANGACLAVDNCGSPIAGDTFHEYQGPITQFDSLCFVCGARPTHALRVKGHVRVIGACATHVELVKQLKPENKPAATLTVKSADGESRIAEWDQPDAPKITLKLSGG